MPDGEGSAACGITLLTLLLSSFIPGVSRKRLRQQALNHRAGAMSGSELNSSDIGRSEILSAILRASWPARKGLMNLVLFPDDFIRAPLVYLVQDAACCVLSSTTSPEGRCHTLDVLQVMR